MASTSASASITDASAAGAGSTVDFATAKRNVTAVVVPSATLTSGLVHIEASQDSSNWVVVRTVEVTGRENYAVHMSGMAFRYWRGNIVRAVGGGTVRVTFMEADS